MASAETFIEEVKGLLARSMEANTQLASRVSALLQQASREPVPPNATELFARWLDFNLASASVLSTHSTEAMRGLVEAAERSLLGQGASPAKAPTQGADAPVEPPAPIDLHVQGSPGETVRAPFLIANEYERSLDVSFEASALASDAGDEIPAARVSFEPPTLTLAQGQRVVQAAIAIPAKAAAGSVYRGELRIKGYQARTIAIAVTVVAGVPEGGDKASGAAQQTRRKAKSATRAPAGTASAAATRTSAKRSGKKRPRRKPSA